ncbi:hypothetical protein PCYB_094660 [Plasmodium cynomolgi strain B]|uniref:Uncharacterized protein n=1 Tax=Plasmodium cynomolgi (strain B) TaxID=1120755 RepID=K6VBW0_PLACD|nr:hypothetical protein PCYB_094660 [Plasmodium cynomolgi strain B]GAB66682.1 hypothetical protein PCYB_094660 [Plasmodium cynomolgi strain B]
MQKGVSQRKEQNYDKQNMKRTGRRPCGDPPQECPLSLGRYKSSEGNELMDEDRRRGSESNGSSTEERLFTPSYYSGSKKNTINIKIKKNANRNLQHSGGGKKKKEEQKSFIKSLIGKIEEMYKKGSHDEKRNSHKLPFESRPAFLLNEYINIEPTNNVMYRRRTPHKTLRRSDFIGINLKPFVRFKSHHKWDDSHANRSGDPRKRAIIKISSQSPHEVFNPRRMNTNRSLSGYPKPANFYSLKNDVMRGNFPFWGGQRVRNGVGTSVGIHHMGMDKLTDKEFRDPNMYDAPFVHLNPVQRCATYNPWCGGSSAGNVNRAGGAYPVKGTHPHRRHDDNAEKGEHKIRVRINRKGAGRKNEGDGDGEDSDSEGSKSGGSRSGGSKSEGSKSESGFVNKRTHHGRSPLANEHDHLGKLNERNLQKKEKKKKFLVNLSLPLNNPRGNNCTEGERITNLGGNINGDTPSHVLFTSKGERGMKLNVKNRANERIRLRYGGKYGEDKESAKMCSNSTSTCDTKKHKKLLSGIYSSFEGSQQSCCKKNTRCHGSELNIHCMHGSREGSNSSWKKTKKGNELQIYGEGTKRRSTYTWSKAPEQYHVQYERGLHNKADHKKMGKNSSQLRIQTEQNRCIRNACAVKRQHTNSCLQLEDNKKGEPTLSREDCESGESQNERHKYKVEKKTDAVKNEGKLLLLTKRNERLMFDRGKEAPRQNCKMLTWGNSNSGSLSYKLDSITRKKGEKNAKGNREKSLICSNSLEGQEKYKNLRTITIPSDSVDGTNEENPRGKHLIKDGEKFRGEHHIASAFNLSNKIATQDSAMGKYKMVQYYKPGDNKECSGWSSICEDRAQDDCYNGVGKNKGSHSKDNQFGDTNEVLEIKDKLGRSRSVTTALSNSQRNKKREEFPPEQAGRGFPWKGSSRRGVHTTAVSPNEVESSDSERHYNNEEHLYSKGKEKKKLNMYSKGSSLCIKGEVNYNSGTTHTLDRYKSHSGDYSNRMNKFVEGTNSGARDCPVWEHSQGDDPENCLWHRTEQPYVPSGEETSRRKKEAQKNEAQKKDAQKNEAHQCVVGQLGEGRIQVRASQTGNASCPRKMGERADREIFANPDFEDHTNYSINSKMRHRSDLQSASNRKKTARRDKKEKQREQYAESNSHSHHSSKENFENFKSSQLYCTNGLQRKSKKMRSALSGDIVAQKRYSHSRSRSEMLKWDHSREGTTSSGESLQRKEAHHEDERYDKGGSRTRRGNTSSSIFCDYHGRNNIERVLYNSGVASKEEEKAGTEGGRIGRRSRSIDRGSAGRRSRSIDRGSVGRRSRSIDRGSGGRRRRSIDRGSVGRRSRSIDRGSVVNYSHGRHPYGDTKEIAERSLFHDSNNNMSSCKGGSSPKNARRHFPVGTTPNSFLYMSHLSGSAMTSKKPTVINSDVHSDKSGDTQDKQVSVEKSCHSGEDSQFCSDRDEAIIRNIQSKDGKSHVYHIRESVCRKGRGETSSERMVDGRRPHNGNTHHSRQNTLSNEKCRTPQRSHNYHDENEHERRSSRRMSNSLKKGRKHSGNCYSKVAYTDQFAILDNLNSPHDEESDMSRSDHGVNIDAAKCGNKERGNSYVKRHTKVSTSSVGYISNWGNILRENSSLDKTDFPYDPHSKLKERSSGDIIRKGNGNSHNESRFTQGTFDFSKNEQHSKQEGDHHMSFILDAQKEPVCRGDEAGRSMSLGVGRAPFRRERYDKRGDNSGHSIDGKIDQRRDYHSSKRGSKQAHSNRKGDYEEGEEITPHNESSRMKDKKKHQNGDANKYKEARKQKGNHKSSRSYGHSECSQRSGSISEGNITSCSGSHAIYDKINPSAMSRSNRSLQHEEKKKRIKSSDPNLGAHHGVNRHWGKTSRDWHSGHTAQGERQHSYFSGEMEKQPSRGASKWDAEGSWVGERNRRDEYVHVKEDGMSSDRRSAQSAANQLCGKNSKLKSIPSVCSNQEGTRERRNSHCGSASPSIHNCREEEVTPQRCGSCHERSSEMEKKRTLQENQNSVGHNWVSNEGMICSLSRETILCNNEKGEITKGGFPSKTNEYPPNVDIGKDNELLSARRDAPLMSRTMEPKTAECTQGNVTEQIERSKSTPMITPLQFNMVGSANAVEGPIRMENSHPKFPTGNDGHQIMIRKTVSGVVGLKKANEYMKSELNYYLSGGNFSKGSRHCYEEANGKVENSSEVLRETNSFVNGIIRVDVDPPKCSSIGAVDAIDSKLGEDSDAANRLGNYKKGESHERSRDHISNNSLFRGGQYDAGNLGLPSDHTNVDGTNIKGGSAPLNDPPQNGEEGNCSTFNEDKGRSGFDRQNEKIKFNNGMYGYANVSTSQGVNMVNPGDASNLRNNNTLYEPPPNNAVLMSKQYSFVSDPTHRQFLHHPSVAPNSSNFNGMHYVNKAVSMPNLGNINMHGNLFNTGIGNKIGDPVNVTRSDIPSVVHAQANQLPPQKMMQQNFSKVFQVPINYGNISNGLNYNSANVGRSDLLISKRPYGGDLFYDVNGKAYIVGRNGEANTSSVNTLGNYALPSYHLATDNANQSNMNRDELIGQTGHSNLAIPGDMHGGSGKGLKKPSVVL